VTDIEWVHVATKPLLIIKKKRLLIPGGENDRICNGKVDNALSTLML
jgi:hypothetical protein